MNFQIEAGNARLMHINLRSEQHGDEEKPAIDLKFQWPTGNEALALFHPDLREAIFQQSPSDRNQRPVDGVPAALKALVFPNMLPLRWGSDTTGLRLTIDHGMGGKSDLVMHDCTADKFIIKPIEGGSVEITFRVQTSSISGKLMDRLLGLLGHDVPLSLVRQSPVDDEEPHQLDIEKPAAKGKRKGAGEQIQAAFEAGAQAPAS